MFGMTQIFRALESGEFTIEEVDAITGPAIGRPKSATFRTVDIAGVDVLAHVARGLGLELPPFVGEMVSRGMTGAKAGRGFYQKSGDEILTLDPKSLDYRAKQPAKIASLEAARAIDAVGSRIKTLYESKDKAGAFLRATLGPTLEYAAAIADEVAYSRDDIDKAMRWGFGWELGPFGTLAALAVNAQGPTPNSQGTPNFQLPTRVVRMNSGASLIDLGDGVLQIEFHSKMNAIGGDTMQMLQAGVK
jgi:3-hydroxyacyl-CoA dehydrogenase